jgi:hypothetical protein
LTRRFTGRSQLINDLLKEIPAYTKGTAYWFDDLKNRDRTAIKHAKQLIEHNKITKSTNPSTNMHELIEYLINLNNNSN